MINEIESVINKLDKLSDQLELEELVTAAYTRGYLGEIANQLRRTVEEHRMPRPMSVHEGRSKLL